MFHFGKREKYSHQDACKQRPKSHVWSLTSMNQIPNRTSYQQHDLHQRKSLNRDQTLTGHINNRQGDLKIHLFIILLMIIIITIWVFGIIVFCTIKWLVVGVSWSVMEFCWRVFWVSRNHDSLQKDKRKKKKRRTEKQWDDFGEAAWGLTARFRSTMNCTCHMNL